MTQRPRPAPAPHDLEGWADSWIGASLLLGRLRRAVEAAAAIPPSGMVAADHAARSTPVDAVLVDALLGVVALHAAVEGEVAAFAQASAAAEEPTAKVQTGQKPASEGLLR